MLEPPTGESVAVTSQKPGRPFASSTHLPLAVVAPTIAGVTAAQRSAPARAGKLAALDRSSPCGEQAAANAARATVASNLILRPFRYAQASRAEAIRQPSLSFTNSVASMRCSAWRWLPWPWKRAMRSSVVSPVTSISRATRQGRGALAVRPSSARTSSASCVMSSAMARRPSPRSTASDEAMNSPQSAAPLRWRRNLRCSASRLRSSSSRASFARLPWSANAAAGTPTAATGAAISAPDLRKERRSVAESLSIFCSSSLGEELVDVELARMASRGADRAHGKAVLAAVIADARIVHRAHVEQQRAERAVAGLFAPAREIVPVADLHEVPGAAPLRAEMPGVGIGNDPRGRVRRGIKMHRVEPGRILPGEGAAEQVARALVPAASGIGNALADHPAEQRFRTGFVGEVRGIEEPVEVRRHAVVEIDHDDVPVVVRLTLEQVAEDERVRHDFPGVVLRLAEIARAVLAPL